MDSLFTVGFGAGCAALGSLVTGYILKRADHREELSIAGPLEVERKRALDRYEVVRSLSGQLANLRHCVDHVCKDENADSRRSYRGKAKQLSRELRGQARSEIYGVGPDVLSLIHEVTDMAQAILDVSREDDSPEAEIAAREFQADLRHGWIHEVDHLSEHLERAARAQELKWRG